MNKLLARGKTLADAYLERAAELRALAGQLKSEEHKRLLLESAANYERLANIEAQERGAQIAC